MPAFTSERREPQTPRWSAPEPLQLWALEGCSSRCPLSPLPWHLRHELRHSHNLHRRAMPCQLRLPLLRSLPAYAVRAQSWWHEHEQHPRKAQRSYGCFGLSVRLQCHAIFAFSFLIPRRRSESRQSAGLECFFFSLFESGLPCLLLLFPQRCSLRRCAAAASGAADLRAAILG